MKITRTANAGVLLELQGKKILLDGVAGKVFPYLPTPEEMKDSLLSSDVLIYTHIHPDHFDRTFTEKMSLRGSVIPPAEGIYNVGDIKVYAIPTRHIGKWDINHCSFCIRGEKTVWFMGDASPDALSLFEGAPDVIIVPFAYVNTESSVKRTLSAGAKKIMVLHLPEKENDPYGLWDSVLSCTQGINNIIIPRMGETVEI